MELRNHQRQLESDLQKVESLQREIQGLNTENSRLVAELQQVYAVSCDSGLEESARNFRLLLTGTGSRKDQKVTK